VLLAPPVTRKLPSGVNARQFRRLPSDSALSAQAGFSHPAGLAPAPETFQTRSLPSSDTVANWSSCPGRQATPLTVLGWRRTRTKSPFLPHSLAARSDPPDTSRSPWLSKAMLSTPE